MGCKAPSRVRIPPSPSNHPHPYKVPVSFSIADSSDGPRKVVIRVAGDLDAESGRAVRARLSQAQRHGRSNVVLDLAGVTFIDSGALNAIVNGAKEMVEAANLQVISPPERVAQVLIDAGMSGLFKLTPDRRLRRDDRRVRSIPVVEDRRRGDRRQSTDPPPPGATLDRR